MRVLLRGIRRRSREGVEFISYKSPFHSTRANLKRYQQLAQFYCFRFLC
jgi:hypothetical protein